MANERIFDKPHYQALDRARLDLLSDILPKWKHELGLNTALDLGCGVGHFSALLKQLGFDVQALEGRQENADEAMRRVPGLQVVVENAESPAVAKLGSFDLVLCFGLLYHLENPFITIRSLNGLTRKIVIIESMCVEGDLPALYLRDEGLAEDQGLQYVAFYPTEACLIKMLYRAGFPNVSKFVHLPNHEVYSDRITQKKSRTILAAANVPFSSSELILAPEPKGVDDPWSTPLGRVAQKLPAYTPFVGKRNAGR